MAKTKWQKYQELIEETNNKALEIRINQLKKRKKTLDEIGELREQGLSLEEVGKRLGITRQGVWQFIHYKVRK